MTRKRKGKSFADLSATNEKFALYFASISKNMLGWIPIVFVYIACTGSDQATMAPVFTSKPPCAMFDSILEQCEITASF